MLVEEVTVSKPMRLSRPVVVTMLAMAKRLALRARQTADNVRQNAATARATVKRIVSLVQATVGSALLVVVTANVMAVRRVLRVPLIAGCVCVIRPIRHRVRVKKSASWIPA